MKQAKNRSVKQKACYYKPTALFLGRLRYREAIFLAAFGRTHGMVQTIAERFTANIWTQCVDKLCLADSSWLGQSGQKLQLIMVDIVPGHRQNKVQRRPYIIARPRRVVVRQFHEMLWPVSSFSADQQERDDPVIEHVYSQKNKCCEWIIIKCRATLKPKLRL